MFFLKKKKNIWFYDTAKKSIASRNVKISSFTASTGVLNILRLSQFILCLATGRILWVSVLLWTLNLWYMYYLCSFDPKKVKQINQANIIKHFDLCNPNSWFTCVDIYVLKPIDLVCCIPSVNHCTSPTILEKKKKKVQTGSFMWCLMSYY